MSSNNDNKENISNEKEEMSDEINKSFESDEEVESEENLIEIIGGEIDYPEEKVSLTDAIKYAFDMNDEASEQQVVENADEEVVFVAPERIMNFVDDYLNHSDNEEESSEQRVFEPTSEIYFSTEQALNEGNNTQIDNVFDEEEQLDEPRNIADILDEVFYDANTDECSESVEEITGPENGEFFESEEEVIKPEDGEFFESEEEAAESEDEGFFESEEEVTEPEDGEFFESEEEVTEPEDEEFFESEEEAAEPEDEEFFESEEEVTEPEDEYRQFAEEASETENESNYDEDDLTDLNRNSDDDLDESKIFEDDKPEEIPEIFSLGKDVLKNKSAEDEENAYESDGAEEIAADDDVEDIPIITVHRHRSASDDEAGDDIGLYETEEDADSARESDKKSFFERHNIADWAKSKTIGGWVKFGLKCACVLLVVLCVSAVLYFNGLLNLINYKSADDFEQYYNLSDTDYVAGDQEVYSDPVYYNASTTIEGFDESMIDIPKESVINILLIGTDVRSGTYDDRGNTDSMILMSINTRDKNIKLTSFMRDMYVTIPGRGQNRINAAYAYGGPQLLFDTLKTNFDVDVDLYVRVNFDKFRKIIDQVGGVEIELTEAEARYMNKYSYKYGTDTVYAGLQTLDGAQALSYARCRKIDSDFNRTQRQRKVILAFIDKIKSSNITELNSLLNTLLPMVQTNVSKMQIVSLLVDSFNYLNNEVETLNVPIKNSWQSATINKMSVLCPNFELNKTAIVAHIYSTYKLDVEDTVFQSFEIPDSDPVTKATTRTTTRKASSTTSSTTTSSSVDESSTPSTDPTVSDSTEPNNETSQIPPETTTKSNSSTTTAKNFNLNE